MPPEQARGVVVETDHRVDLFALGAILYRLLVGQAPYANLTPEECLPRVRRGQWDREALQSSGVPEPLQAICFRAMDPDPSKRFADAAELAEKLDRVIDASPPADPATTPPPSTASRRSPAATAGLVATVGLVAIAGVAAIVIVASAMAARFRGDSPAAATDPAAGLVDSPQVSAPEGLIESFELIHIGNSADRAEFSGQLLQFRPPRVNDDIQIRAEFTAPAYCFLVALNPDGTKQLCYPPSGDVPQEVAIERLWYPAEEKAAFGLTDGVGQQAFVLVASRDPLPAYDVWDADLTSAPWPHPDVVGNWRYVTGELQSLVSRAVPAASLTRGTVRDTLTPTPFKELCDRLWQDNATDVRGVIFEIEPL